MSSDDQFEPDDDGVVEFDGAAPEDVDLAAYHDLMVEAPVDYDWPPMLAEAGATDGLWHIEDGRALADAEIDGDISLLSGHIRDEPVRLDGPAEPVATENEDGTRDIEIKVPAEGGERIQTIELGTWFCARCGTTNAIEPGPKGVQEPQDCSGCGQRGPFVHDGDEHAPGGDIRQLSEPFWFLPGECEEDGYQAVFDDVREWIYDYWVVHPDREYLYDGLAAWAITTWLRPNFNELAHVVVMGKFSGGKTRLLNTLRRVSYRAATTVDQTEAFLTRAIETFDGTFLLSEYHDLDKERQQDIRGVFKGSQKRWEDIGKTEGDYHNPRLFGTFGHMGVATQKPLHDDMLSRSIQVQTSKPHRESPDRFDEQRARELRSRLLYARWRLLGPNYDDPMATKRRTSQEWARAEEKARAWLEERDIENRTREKLWAITTVAVLWDRLEQIEDFIEAMHEQAQEAESESADARFIEVVRDLAIEARAHLEADDQDVIGDPWSTIFIPYWDIKERFNEVMGWDAGESHIGDRRSNLGLNAERQYITRDWDDGSSGAKKKTGIRDDELEDKLKKLCADVGIPFELPADVDEPDEGEAPGTREAVQRYIREEAERGDKLTPGAIAGSLNAEGVDASPDQVGHALYGLAQQRGSELKKVDDETYELLG